MFSEGFALGNDRAAGSWILFSSAMGAERGTEGRVSVSLCSLAEPRCSTGGDSQAYQVKKKCLATEGFSCWVTECVCVSVGGVIEE